MIKLYDHGVCISHQHGIVPVGHPSFPVDKQEACKGTISWSILSAHNTSGDHRKLKINLIVWPHTILHLWG